MIIKHKLEIDLVQQKIVPRLNTMQNDANSRALEISLLENGFPWEIPADITAALNYCKPDGTAGLYDTLPDGSAAYTISGNTVTIFLAPQVLTVPGLVRASVILTHNTVQIATFPLTILVEARPGAGAEKSENYYYYTSFDELNDAIGNLADLKTEDKSSVVAAVNEIALEAGSGTVKSINGIEPDANGNVEINAGEPGFSPTVIVNEITGGTYVHIRDQEGTKSAFIPNGKDGESVSVATTIQSTEDGGLNVVTFSDMKSIAIRNGRKGSAGYTPVKGVDYWTAEDKAGIVAEVVEALDDSPEIIITTNESGYWYNNNGVPEFYAPTDGGAVCSQETNYIKATKGDTFRVTTRTSDGHPANGAWYDANMNVISIIIVEADSQIVKTVDLTAPAGTAYARFFTTTWGAIDYLAPLEVEYLGQVAENTEPASPLKGKKIVYDGDSICASWGISINGGSFCVRFLFFLISRKPIGYTPFLYYYTHFYI